MSKLPEVGEEEDDYRESEDEDYNPNEAEGGSDEEDVDEEDKKLDSTYSQYQGRGGLIKTRAQRRAEAEGRLAPSHDSETQAKPVVGQASIDVDALWKEMNSGPTSNVSSPAPTAAATPTDSSKNSEAETKKMTPPNEDSDEYITISRTFKFAGEVKTETKRVPRSSAEGQDYLKEQKLKGQQLQESQRQAENSENQSSDQTANEASSESRPRSRGRGPVKRKMSLMEEYQMNKTKKINTLEKSRLDWLGFVDKEGIHDDLTKHNKGGYLDRQNFLNRVDQKLDRDMRQQRAKRMQ